MITPNPLTAAIRAMGVAQVFVGDPFTAEGMSVLGATEGEIALDIPEEENKLTAPELTGGIAHQATVTLGEVVLRVPLIIGDRDLWAKISATGTRSGGWSGPQAVVPTSVLVIPLAELGGGLAYDGTTYTRTAGNGIAGASGAGAAPQNAVWLWRAYPRRPGTRFRNADGGKVILEVPFTAMFDAARPEGHKVFTIGDPVAQGITTVRL